MMISEEASREIEISKYERDLYKIVKEYEAVIDKIAKNQIRNDEFQEAILGIANFLKGIYKLEPELSNYIINRLTKALMFNTSITEVTVVGFKSLEFMDYIFTAIRVNRSIQKLTIKAEAITAEDMEKLAAGLIVNQSITSLDIACTHAIRESDDKWAPGLVAIIESNKRITHLVLDNFRLSDIMVKYTAVCAALLKNKTLTSISLMNLHQGIAPGCTNVQNTFMEMLATHPSITEIDLSHNYLAEEGMQGIKTLLTENQRITYLGLDRVMPGAGARAIKVPFSKHASIKGLDFNQNFGLLEGILGTDLSFDVTGSIVDVFADPPKTLEEVNLRDMNFTFSEFQKLINSLKMLPNLRKISLDLRALRKESGWMKILSEIFNKPTMKSIDCYVSFDVKLPNNTMTKDIKEFSEMLAQHTTLEELTVRGTFGVRVHHPWAKEFSGFLKKTKSLRVLNLECISDTFPFLHTLKENNTVTTLCFSYHNLTEEMDDLLEILKVNKTIRTLELGAETGPRNEKGSIEMKAKIAKLHEYLKRNQEAYKAKMRKEIAGSKCKALNASVQALIFSYADCATEEQDLASKYQEQRILEKECVDGLNVQYKSLSEEFQSQLSTEPLDFAKIRAGKKKVRV